MRAKPLREMSVLWRQVASSLSLMVERERQLAAAKALDAEAERLEIEANGLEAGLALLLGLRRVGRPRSLPDLLYGPFQALLVSTISAQFGR